MAKQMKFHDQRLDRAQDMIEQQRKKIETLNRLTNNAITSNIERIKEMETKHLKNEDFQ